MQLRRAMEIVNTQDDNSNIFYKEDFWRARRWNFRGSRKPSARAEGRYGHADAGQVIFFIKKTQ